ncbi:MAG TPA: NAD-dependent epimerase/dehydratase family protein, partial [Flavitalea sp.]|nr:NAD-dependent epimerase/dehydratase family protein [Flavitalea sp.]
FNYLGLQEEVVRINFEKRFFQDEFQLRAFVKQCDVIVHLAAINRHNDPESLYQTNINLVQQLLDAMEAEAVTPHIIFSSSTHEETDSIFGRSKKEGRQLFLHWARQHNARFTGLVIPNVFGPFGDPYYNSVIATFSYQLTHDETPKIETDRTLKLIYIAELIEEIWKIIKEKICEPAYFIMHTAEAEVSQILSILESYRDHYFKRNILPEIHSRFDLNLFNTFRSYINYSSHYPVLLKSITDDRGSFVETVKTLTGGQFSFSSTYPGITRGNHFHTRKIERFTVITGKAVIELRRIGTTEVLHFELDGKQPAFVDMPVWYTHNITNVGSEALLTLFWINEFFDPNDPDTYFESVWETKN